MLNELLAALQDMTDLESGLFAAAVAAIAMLIFVM
jgi:hypothetical protein